MNYKLSYNTWSGKEKKELQKVIKTGMFTMGKKVKKFEKITPQEKIIKRIAKSFTTPLHLRVYNKLIRILF